MPKTLPQNATPASRRLYNLAARLADACPPELASEIALVGSAALGFSDERSDLDINFWAAAIPPEAARMAWLESMGATDIRAQHPRSDRSYGIGCVMDGIDVGCSWQTFNALHFFVDLICEGELVLEDAIHLETLADVLHVAISLRSAGEIDLVQKRLDSYPEKWRRQQIEKTVGVWAAGAGLKAIWKHVRYQNEIQVTAYAADTLSELIDLLYPINRRWSPQVKWRHRFAGDLPLQPPTLDGRIGLALHDPQLRLRPIHVARLMLDTLALVKDEYDVSAAVSAIQTFMKENE